MPCFHPYPMWPAPPGARNRRYVAAAGLSYPGAVPVMMPCGGCQGCRAAKTVQWKERLMLEARYHDDMHFVTYTYRDEELPADFSVSKRAVQLLHKRMRKAFSMPIRNFTIGEYGGREDATKRPHYHGIHYGLRLDDLCDESVSKSGFPQWRSPSLEAVWPFGHVWVGKFSEQVASYVAGYCFKKVNGDRAADHYRRAHSVTGELVDVKPEFALMSRRPAIGFEFFEEFFDTDIQGDFLTRNGRKVPMPRYFKKKRLERMTREEAELREAVERHEAKMDLRKQAADMTPERLAVREEAFFLKGQHLARGGGIG